MRQQDLELCGRCASIANVLFCLPYTLYTCARCEGVYASVHELLTLSKVSFFFLLIT